MISRAFSLGRLAGLALVFAFISVGCGKDGPKVERPVQVKLDAVSLDGLSVSKDDKELVYQYFTSSGEPVVATEIDKIPEELRTNVMVLFSGEKRKRIPANALVLADLTQTNEDGTHPMRMVNRYDFKVKTREQAAGAPAAAAAVDGVTLYTSPGCPHCTRARAWFTEQGIPFIEKDVSRDPAAVGEIMSLGRAQGIPETYLSSVPIIVVNGKMLVGFDPSQVKAALHKS